MAHGGMLSARDRATGEVRIISEVVSGEACHCQCAQCGAILVARKGKIRAHHFAHKSGSDSQMRACQETALHNAAKRLLAHHLDRLTIPTKALNRPTDRFVLPEPITCTFSETLTPASRTLSLADGDIEPALPGTRDIRPDAWASSAELGPVYCKRPPITPCQV
ncbi:competence protein CoiA family protein [Marinobacter denitrificans]|uniref:competence protein CoiA family protein n=1 Tax=Marinobacter TaxID=2742 RepID=UPI001246C9DC